MNINDYKGASKIPSYLEDLIEKRVKRAYENARLTDLEQAVDEITSATEVKQITDVIDRVLQGHQRVWAHAKPEVIAQYAQAVKELAHRKRAFLESKPQRSIDQLKGQLHQRLRTWQSDTGKQLDELDKTLSQSGNDQSYLRQLDYFLDGLSPQDWNTGVDALKVAIQEYNQVEAQFAAQAQKKIEKALRKQEKRKKKQIKSALRSLQRQAKTMLGNMSIEQLTQIDSLSDKDLTAMFSPLFGKEGLKGFSDEIKTAISTVRRQFNDELRSQIRVSAKKQKSRSVSQIIKGMSLKNFQTALNFLGKTTEDSAVELVELRDQHLRQQIMLLQQAGLSKEEITDIKRQFGKRLAAVKAAYKKLPTVKSFKTPLMSTTNELMETLKQQGRQAKEIESFMSGEYLKGFVDKIYQPSTKDNQQLKKAIGTPQGIQTYLHQINEAAKKADKAMSFRLDTQRGELEVFIATEKEMAAMKEQLARGEKVDKSKVLTTKIPLGLEEGRRLGFSSSYHGQAVSNTLIKFARPTQQRGVYSAAYGGITEYGLNELLTVLERANPADSIGLLQSRLRRVSEELESLSLTAMNSVSSTEEKRKSGLSAGRYNLQESRLDISPYLSRMLFASTDNGKILRQIVGGKDTRNISERAIASFVEDITHIAISGKKRNGVLDYSAVRTEKYDKYFDATTGRLIGAVQELVGELGNLSHAAGMGAPDALSKGIIQLAPGIYTSPSIDMGPDYTRHATQSLGYGQYDQDSKALRMARPQSRFMSSKTHHNAAKSYTKDDTGALALFNAAYVPSREYTPGVANSFEELVDQWLATQEGQSWYQGLGVSLEEAKHRLGTVSGEGSIISESAAKTMNLLHSYRHGNISAEEFENLWNPSKEIDDEEAIKDLIVKMEPTVRREDIKSPKIQKDLEGNVEYIYHEIYKQMQAKLLGLYTGTRQQTVSVAPDSFVKFVGGQDADILRRSARLGSNDQTGFIVGIIERARLLAEQNGQLQDFLNNLLSSDSPFSQILQWDAKNNALFTTGKQLNIGEAEKFIRENSALFPNYNRDGISLVSEPVNAAQDYAYRRAGAIGPREFDSYQNLITMLQRHGQSTKMMQQVLDSTRANADSQTKQEAENYRQRMIRALHDTFGELRKGLADVVIGFGEGVDIDLSSVGKEALSISDYTPNGNINSQAYDTSLARRIDDIFVSKLEDFKRSYKQEKNPSTLEEIEEYAKALDEFVNSFRVIFKNPKENSLLHTIETSYGAKYATKGVVLPWSIGQDSSQGGVIPSETLGSALSMARQIQQYSQPDADNNKNEEERFRSLSRTVESVTEGMMDDITNKSSRVQTERFHTVLPHSRFLEMNDVSGETSDLARYGIGLSRSLLMEMLGGEDRRSELINQYKYMYGSNAQDEKRLTIDEIKTAIIDALNPNNSNAVNHELFANTLRFPTIQGTMDMLPLQVYESQGGDDGVAINNILASFFKGDYDRDHGFVQLLTGLPSFSGKDFTSYMEELKSFQIFLRRVVDNEAAIAGKRQTAKNETGLFASTVEEINAAANDPKIQDLVGQVAQINRGSIGSWSTVASKIRNGMNADGIIGVNATSLENQAAGMALEQLFAIIEQEYISYKHIAKRAKNSKTGGTELIGESDRLYKMVTDMQSGAGRDIGSFFDAINATGIIDSSQDARRRLLLQRLLYGRGQDDEHVLKQAAILQKKFGFSDEQLGIGIDAGTGKKRVLSKDELTDKAFLPDVAQFRKMVVRAQELSPATILAGGNGLGYLNRKNNVRDNENLSSDNQRGAWLRDVAGVRPLDGAVVGQLNGELSSNSTALNNATSVLSKILTVLQRDTGISGNFKYEDTLTPSRYSHYLAGTPFNSYSENKASQMSLPLVNRAIGNLPILAQNDNGQLARLQQAVQNMPVSRITQKKLKKMGYSSREEYDEAVFNSMAANYGKLIHKYLELDTTYGGKHGSLNEILAYLASALGDKDTSPEVQKDAREVQILEAQLLAQAKASGVKKSENLLDYYRLQGADISAWVKRQGITLKTAETGLAAGNIHGITDAFGTRTEADGRTTGYFLDWKNYKGKLGKEAFIQALMYEAIGREVKKQITEAGKQRGFTYAQTKSKFSSGTKEDAQFIDEIYEQVINSPTLARYQTYDQGKYKISKDLFREIGLVDRLSSGILHNKGNGQISLTANPQGLPEFVYQKLLSGTARPDDFEAFRVIENVFSELEHSKEIDKLFRGFGWRDTEKTPGKSGSGGSEDTRKQNQDLKEYLQLLINIYNIKKKIQDSQEMQNKSVADKDAYKEYAQLISILEQRLASLDKEKARFNSITWTEEQQKQIANQKELITQMQSEAQARKLIQKEQNEQRANVSKYNELLDERKKIILEINNLLLQKKAAEMNQTSTTAIDARIGVLSGQSKDLFEQAQNMLNPADGKSNFTVEEKEALAISDKKRREEIRREIEKRKAYEAIKQEREPTNEQQQEYNKLLEEEKKLLIAIAKLEQDRFLLRRRGESTEVLDTQITALQAYQQEIHNQAETYNHGWTKKQENENARKANIRQSEIDYQTQAYKVNSTAQDEVQAERDFQSLLNNRLNIEKKIESAQHTIAISAIPRQKEALQEVISACQQELKLTDENIVKLTKSGALRKEAAKEALRTYQIQKNEMIAQTAAKDKGSRSVWDVLKNDIRRAFSHITYMGVSYRIIGKIRQGLSKIVTIAKTLANELTNLRIVTGMNQRQAEATMLVYQKLGKELHATTQEVAQSAVAWLRQGYSVDEASHLVTQSLKLSKLAFMDASAATQTLTATMKGFKLEAGDLDEVVDKLTAIDSAAAVTAQGVSEALSLVANSASMAGYSLDETVAMVSTIGEVTQQSMSTVGNTVKTLVARFGNVKAGAFASMSEEGEELEGINDTEKVLKTIGIAIRTSTLEMRNMGDVLDDLAEKWATLDTVTRNAIATSMAGTRQREGFNALLNNYERYKELVDESANSAGTADEKFKAYAESMEATFKDLENTWESLVQHISASPIIQGATKFLTGIMKILPKIAPMIAGISAQLLLMKLPSWTKIGGGLWGKGQLAKGVVGGLFGNRGFSKLSRKINAKNKDIQDQINSIQQDNSLTDEEKKAQIAILEKKKTSWKYDDEGKLKDQESGEDKSDNIVNAITAGAEKEQSLLQQIISVLQGKSIDQAFPLDSAKTASGVVTDTKVSDKGQAINNPALLLTSGQLLLGPGQSSEQLLLGPGKGNRPWVANAFYEGSNRKAKKSIAQLQRDTEVQRIALMQEKASLEQSMPLTAQQYYGRHWDEYLETRGDYNTRGGFPAETRRKGRRAYGKATRAYKNHPNKVASQIIEYRNGENRFGSDQLSAAALMVDKGQGAEGTFFLTQEQQKGYKELGAPSIPSMQGRILEIDRTLQSLEQTLQRRTSEIQQRRTFESQQEEINVGRNKILRELAGQETERGASAGRNMVAQLQGLEQTKKGIKSLKRGKFSISKENLDLVQSQRALVAALTTLKQAVEAGTISQDSSTTASNQLISAYARENGLSTEEVRANLGLTEAVSRNSAATEANTASQDEQTRRAIQGKATRPGEAQGKATRAGDAPGSMTPGSQEPSKGQRYLSMMGGKMGIASKLTGGAVAGLMQGMSTTTISGRGANKGVSVEADIGDKLITGGMTAGIQGALSLIPGVGPILGGVLGPVLGKVFGGLISSARHEEELARKKRVETAKKEIEALDNLDKSLTNLASLDTKSKIWVAEDYSKAKEYVDELSKVLSDNVDLFEKLRAELGNINTEYQNLSVVDLEKKLLSSDETERSAVLNAIQVASAAQQVDSLYASQEDIRYRAVKAMQEHDAAGTYFNEATMKAATNSKYAELTNISNSELNTFRFAGETVEEQIENGEKFIEQLERAGATTKGLKKIREALNDLKNINGELSKANKELREAEVNHGYLAAGISDLTLMQQQSLTYEGAIQKIANEMEDLGYQARDAAGVIKSEYLVAIESAIKQDSKLNALVNNEVLSFNDLTKAQDKLASVVTKQGIKGKSIAEQLNIGTGNVNVVDVAYEKLKKLIEQATPENRKDFKALAESIGMTSDALMGLVYSANPDKLLDMAQAANMTLDTFKNLQGELGEFSLADFSKSAEDTRAKFEDYSTFYSDFANTGTLSAENIEKILSSHPEMVSMLGDENVLRKYLAHMNFDEGSGARILYGQNLFKDMKSNERIFSNLKDQLVGEEGSQQTFNELVNGFINEKGMSQAIKNAWENATTYEDARNALRGMIEAGGTDIEEALKEFWDFEIKYQIDTTEMDKVIEYQTNLIDKQIENLNEQKEALSNINEQRKKELDLVKAEIALENASKEKKRVYRAGVGFVYEEDTEAVKEAQETLDNAETEREQELLDLEIQRLELQKEILDFIPNEAEMEALKDTFDSWKEKVSQSDEALGDIVSQLSNLYKEYETIKFKDIAAEDLAAADEGDKIAMERMADALASLNNAKAAIGNNTKNVQGEEVNKTTLDKRTDAVSFNNARKSVIEAFEALKNRNPNKDDSTLFNELAEMESIKKMNLTEADIKALIESEDMALPNLTGSAKLGKSKNLQGNVTLNEKPSNEVRPEQLEKQFSKTSDTRLSVYNNETGGWGPYESAAAYSDRTETSYALDYNQFSKLPAYTLIGNTDYDNAAVFVGSDKKIYWLGTGEDGQFAEGSLGIERDTTALVNELGTEAIITPQGTVTALPSKTGIVPADITKNLWALGEAAPNLISRLSSLNIPSMSSNSSTTHNDGTFIDTLNMTVYPTKDYDMDKFIREAKARAKISNRNN